MIQRPVTESRSYHRNIAALLIIILFVPVFFNQSGLFNSISLSDRGFPVSLLVVLFFPFAVFSCRFLTVLGLLTAVIVCVFLPVAIFGIFNSKYFALSLAMTYLSSPFVAFTIYSLTKKLDPTITSEKFLLIGSYSIGIVTLFWVPYQASNVLSMGRANGSVMDIFVIYQVWVYWPTALAIALCASFLSTRPHLWILRGFMFLGVFFTGAREPFLFIFVFGVIFCLATDRIKYFILLMFSGVVFFMLLLTYLNLYPDSLISLKFTAMLSGETSLDGGRLGVLEQFELSKINFFWGTGFSEYGIFGSPHNQYIELYYRGGIFGLILSAILLVSWIRSYGRCSKLVWSLFGAVLLVTNIVNTPIRVPYTGAIIWTLLFFLIEKKPNHQRDTSILQGGHGE